jgi:outer membrane protein OmpA-like peptidoglycan-associated protein
MNDVPNLKIEISGHTDSKGSADYNKKLSERRAKAVVDYLVAKGVSSDRLRYAGYGMDRPLVSNDDETGRQLNRRTEFEIIGN